MQKRHGNAFNADDRLLWPRLAVHPHVLGEVKQITVGKVEVRALMLYETSVARDHVPAELPAIRGKVIGDMDGIRCTICGQPVTDWHSGKDSIDAMISRITGLPESVPGYDSHRLTVSGPGQQLHQGRPESVPLR